MDWTLKLAAVVFVLSILTLLVTGLSSMWLGTEALTRMFFTAALAWLASGSYIALRDALHRLRVESRTTSHG